MVISSLVIEVMPEHVHNARTKLEDLEGVEVHSVHENRLVVTIEAETVDDSHDIASSFIHVPGVYGVNLVYANFEDDPTLLPRNRTIATSNGEDHEQ